MDEFFFIYTLIIMFACGAAVVLALTTWAIMRKKGSLPQAGFFAFYVFDLADIFRNEWIAQTSGFQMDTYYEVESPGIRIIIACALMLFLWVMLLDLLDDVDPTMCIAPVAIFGLASALVLTFMPYGPLRQWVFYTLRQVAMAGALGYAFYKYRTSTDTDYRTRLSRYRVPFIIFCLLVVAVVIEDTFVILMVPPESVGSWLPLYLSERNFSENILMLYVAWLVCRYSLDQLHQRS